MENPQLTPQVEIPDRQNDIFGQRHWIVTVYLVAGCLINAFLAFWYPFSGNAPYSDSWLLDPDTRVNLTFPIICGFLAGLNVVFYAALIRGKLFGFSGYCWVTIAMFFIRAFLRNDILSSAAIACIAIGLLYSVLQIKKEDRTAWELLS